MGKPKKEVGEVIKLAQSHGWELDGYTGSGHWKIRHKSGSTFILPQSPNGGNRWRQNALAHIRRIDSKEQS